jgi:hypothetical protein
MLAVVDLCASRLVAVVGYDTPEKRAEVLRRYGAPMPLVVRTPEHGETMDINGKAFTFHHAQDGVTFAHPKYDPNYTGPVDSREAFIL